VLRRIVALESGTVVEYPAGREPLAGHDLRHQYWYQEAKKTGDLVWSAGAAPTDGKGTMIAALPLYLSAGAFAGVTAIEISLAEWFASPQFTQPWFGAVRKMLVVLAEPEKDDPMWRLHIIAEEAVEDRAGRVNGHFLEADDPGQMAVLLEDIRAGRPGSRLIRHGGHETHWIYGPAEAGKPFPLVIVSHEQLAAPAYAAEEHVRESLAAELKSTGLIFLGAIGLVVGLAVSSSRRVTLPLRRLAERAERLADGEYQSRIDIRTGDELQDLGDVFNTLGPRLQEREKMASALALAQVIQQRLLPQSAPRITGFDVAGACAFSDETGGDYYDFIELDGRWGIAVGDVTGHGIGSALIMAAARGTLRSYAGREELGALFEAINRHLIRDVEDQQFMTLFYAELDVANCSIQWNSAGQGPVFLYRRRSGEIDDLAVTGIPLGIMAESTWVPSGPLLLHAGDVLLVGTDGIWETRNPAGEMFGTRRLCRMLATLTDDSAAGICSAIVEQVKNFRGGKHSEDDLTVVVIRATG
jgi:sigma-B regulation protein RsbU (phosphoserine phosphatase)